MQLNPDWIEHRNRLRELKLDFSLDKDKVEVPWIRMIKDEYNTTSWHAHTDIELHYVHKGKQKIAIGTETVVVEEGNAILIGAGVRHSLDNTFHESCTRFVIMFRLNPEQGDSEIAALHHVLALDYFIVFCAKQLSPLFMDCLKEAVEHPLGFLSRIKANVIHIIVEAARNIRCSHPTDYQVPVYQSSEGEDVEKIYQFIEKEACHKVQVKDIAQFMNMSEKQVQRVLARKMSITPRQLIRDIRLKQAKEFLQDPELSLAQIASLVGFASEQSFSRFFKTMEGLPPGKYRASQLPE